MLAEELRALFQGQVAKNTGTAHCISWSREIRKGKKRPQYCQESERSLAESFATERGMWQGKGNTSGQSQQETHHTSISCTRAHLQTLHGSQRHTGEKPNKCGSGVKVTEQSGCSQPAGEAYLPGKTLAQHTQTFLQPSPALFMP